MLSLQIPVSSSWFTVDSYFSGNPHHKLMHKWHNKSESLWAIKRGTAKDSNRPVNTWSLAGSRFSVPGNSHLSLELNGEVKRPFNGALCHTDKALMQPSFSRNNQENKAQT